MSAREDYWFTDEARKLNQHAPVGARFKSRKPVNDVSKKANEIADEAWRMLPDSCKEIMKGLKETYKESIVADVEHLFGN